MHVSGRPGRAGRARDELHVGCRNDRRRRAPDLVRDSGGGRRRLGPRDVVRIVERERQRSRERGGIGGVLRLPPAHQERAVVDRERAERDQRQHRDRDVHEDCPALVARQTIVDCSSSKSSCNRRNGYLPPWPGFVPGASGAGRKRVGCVGSGGTSSGIQRAHEPRRDEHHQLRSARAARRCS